MANKNYFLNGVSELLILSILDKSDSYIYEIRKIINEVSNDYISISQNTIYAAAYKLEDEGKISEYSKLVGKRRQRIYYHIEPKGKEYLEELTTNYNMVVSAVNNILNYINNRKELPDE